MSKQEHQKYADRIKRLKRRADWLESQVDSTRADIQFTKAELSALRWAIPILEDYAQAQFAVYRAKQDATDSEASTRGHAHTKPRSKLARRRTSHE